MEKLNERFDQLIAEQRELKKKFQTEAQAMFKEVTKEFFDKNPAITALVWTQYTPYFNDGDACVFRVNDVTFTNAPDDELENVSPWGEYEGDLEDVWVEYFVKNIPDSNDIDKKSCEFVSKMIGSSEMEDIMLEMFGDHVKVVATRNGFDVEDYDHD
jgi:hypothetical protein